MKHYYSGQARKVLFCPRRGKKKRHTLKSQVVMDVQSKKILGTAHGKGAKHEFALFKDNDPHLQSDVWIVADKGY